VRNGVRIVPFEPEHGLRVTQREFEPEAVGFGRRELLDLCTGYRRQGVGWTGLADGEVVACGGIRFIGNGTGEGWAFTSPLVPRFMKTFHRTFRDKIADTIATQPLQRIFTQVREDWPTSQRWLARLGFHPVTVGGEIMRHRLECGATLLVFARIC
jgi:hypothetical protein